VVDISAYFVASYELLELALFAYDVSSIDWIYL